MNILDKTRLLQTSILTGLLLGLGSTAYAQTADEEPVLEVIEEEEADSDSGDEVVVTGSRIKRDTFTSTAPIQVLTRDQTAEEGLFNPVEILQTNAAASGQQIDSTFQGFVLDNGPGSETVNLRDLGAERTLVLANGRRLAPSGVEGAPAQASINLIPATMVDRFELLLDGASAVYGSDAVAGVVNVIIRNDYDGLELDALVDTPEQGAGQDYTLGARYGVTADRGFIGGAVEYSYQDPWFASDRDFLNNDGLGCETFREVTESGEIRTNDLSFQALDQALGIDSATSPCRATRLTQRIITLDGGFGSIYYQPDINNTGLGFSESTLFGVPIDGNGDGLRDVNFFDFSPNGQQSEIQQIVNEQEQVSLYGHGEYTFEGDTDNTIYFEALYVNNDVQGVGGQPQLFPTVGGDNPFNTCNIANNDCGAAYNSILTDPDYVQRFTTYLNSDLNPFGTTNCFGLPDAICTPSTFGLLRPEGVSIDVLPVVGVLGDRNQFDVSLKSTRVVGGLKGDLPFINNNFMNDWSYDVSAQYSYNQGESVRTGIRGDRLDFALGNDLIFGNPIAGAQPCVIPDGVDRSLYTPDVTNGCVPVNLFAPSLLNTAAGGDFATAAEREYLFDDRTFDTRIGQLILEGIIQGDLIELPGGEASILLGATYREDTIDSNPNDVASDGLLFGFFADGGALGDVTNKELFGELSLPLGTGDEGLRELNVDLAGRITDNEFYGTNGTYSIKAGWRPIDSLLLRGTLGTSFRAPNLRELFLRAQSGFNNGFGDPCAVPDAAFIQGLDGNGAYDRSSDPRTDLLLDNCRAAGIDPETYRAGNGVYSIEVFSGGVATGGTPGFEDLDPETSTSYTLGFSFEQPFVDSFDFQFGMTYFNLEIEDAIFGTGSGFVANACYGGPANLSSPFCNLVDRPFGQDIDTVNTPFLNLNEDNAEFIDYNFRFDKDDILLFDRSWDTTVRGQLSQYLARENLLSGNPGEPPLFDDRVGDFSTPEFAGSATASFQTGKWQGAWTTRFISGVSAPEEIDMPADPEANNRLLAVDGFTNIFDDVNTFNGAGSVSTCLGPDNGDVNCRTVFTAPDYFVHNLTFQYTGDTDWAIRVGVNNVFDKSPPLVSPREVFSINNIPVGSGYDLNGREYFARVTKTF